MRRAPTAILDVLRAAHNEGGPGLLDRQDFHVQSLSHASRSVSAEIAKKTAFNPSNL